MFFNAKENKLVKSYFKGGHVIEKAVDQSALKELKSEIVRNILIKVPKLKNQAHDYILNDIHKFLPVSKLNDFRLDILHKINKSSNFRKNFYYIAKSYLETLVGNELAMQYRINLSIQYPKDNSSLLDVHADTWSGDSPFEIVVWLPLVDCYRTKAMYLLEPKHLKAFNKNFGKRKFQNSEILFQSIKRKVKWIKIKYGQVLFFNQMLPHGNRVNSEKETRWSLNCRFKGVFTPYGDKKIGEFFEPITLRPVSKQGMNYKLPK